MATEVERVVFELLARNYVREAGRLIIQNAQLSKSFGTLEKASARISGGKVAITLKRINAEGLQVTRTIRNAATANERLAETFTTVATKAKATESSIQKITKRISDLGRIVGLSLLIGSVFRLQQAFEDSFKAASEFSIKIAEIETITTNNELATEQWANELRKLSSAFGIDVLGQAEAAYQILSNQVAQGTDAIRLLDIANRLAVTGVTDTASAVNLLTATINAFRLPVEDAALISAQFFKTVELGRVRIEEMSQSFGRVALPASLLGVSLQELQAAIALTTIQGVKFNEASTLIRNILLKLIRPTDEMKRFFAELGVASGEAAIETFTFSGFLAKLEERTKGSSTEIGNLFGRIRAITGAMVFAGDNTQRFQETLEKIEGTTLKEFAEDTNRVLQSTGQQLKIAGEQAKNFFEKEIGRPALKAIVALITELGGMENILKETTDAVRVLGDVFLVLLAGKAIPALLIGLNKARLALIAFNVTAALTGAALVPILVTVGAVTVGISQLIKQANKDALASAEAANLRIFESREKALSDIRKSESQATTDFEKEIKKRSQVFLQANAKQLSDINKSIIEIEKQGKKLRPIFKDIAQELGSGIKKQVSEASKEFKKFTKVAEDAAKEINKILETATKGQFQIDLSVAGLGGQISLLEQEIKQAQDRVRVTSESNDLKNFKNAAKRVKELTNLRIKAQINLGREESRLDQARIQAFIDLGRAQTRSQRSLAQERLQDFKRQRKILQEGTQAQLKAEQDLQAARRKARTATTAQEFKEALAEIQKIRSKQEALNKLAASERKIRKEGFEEAAKLAKQLGDIQVINAQRAKDAAKEEARLRSIQFLHTLITKEADRFNEKEALAIKDAKELNKLIREQLKRFEELRAISAILGGGQRADAIFRQKSDNLRSRAQQQLNKLESEARRDRDKALSKELKDRQKIAQEAGRVEREQLALLIAKLEAFQKQARIGVFAGDEVERGQAVRRTFGQQIPGITERQREPGFVELSKRLDLLVVLSERLNKILIGQAKKPTEAGEIEAKRIATELRQILIPLLAGQPTFAALPPESRDLLNAARDLSGAAKTLQALPRRETETRDLLKSLRLKIQENEGVKKATLELEKFRENLERVAKGPSVIAPAKPVNLDELFGKRTPTKTGDLLRTTVTKAFKEGTEKGIKEGSEKSKATVRNVGIELGKAQAKANIDALKAQQPDIAQRRRDIERQSALAAQRADIPSRALPTRRLERRRIDTTIRLGRGAEPIAVQEARIQKALLEEQRRQLEARREITGQIDTTIRLGRGAEPIAVQEARIQKALFEQQEKRLEAQEEIRRSEEVERDVALARGKARAAGSVRFDSIRGLVTRAAPRDLLPSPPSTGEETPGQKEALEALRKARLGEAGVREEGIKRLGELNTERLREIGLNIDLRELLGQERITATNLALENNNVNRNILEERKKILASLKDPFDQKADRIDPVSAALGARADQDSSKNLNNAAIQLIEASKQLRETSFILSRVPTIKLRGPTENFAEGGPVSGPAGRDKVPAMLTSGEFVVRKGPTQRFFSQLLAMNSGRFKPQGFQDGGLVTNVGGITINESSSPQATADAIVQKINRGVRQGTIKLRKGRK